jgi:ADP-heptose:LPS heptosyltransferase
MAPAASARVKTWPIKRFAQVFDELVEQGHRQIVVFTGPNDEVIQEFPGLLRYPRALIMIPAHHLRLTAALLHHCSVLVCNDTGIMHLSAAVGCPVVALFGPTPPEVLRPRDGVSRALCDGAFDCKYQVRGKYGIPRCWNAGQCLIAPESCVNRVPVAAVTRAVDGILSRASSQAPSTGVA